MSHEHKLWPRGDIHNRMRCLRHWLVILATSILCFGLLVYTFLRFFSIFISYICMYSTSRSAG